MLTNDLKKGDRIVMHASNWFATIEDNKKGNIRMATVEGLYTETGSVYAHDIRASVAPDGTETPIDYTPAQGKLRKTVAILFA